MISDTLHDAVRALDDYLDHMPEVYSGALRARIIAVRDQMDALRRELDAPRAPDDREPQHP